MIPDLRRSFALFLVAVATGCGDDASSPDASTTGRPPGSEPSGDASTASDSTAPPGDAGSSADAGGPCCDATTGGDSGALDAGAADARRDAGTTTPDAAVPDSAPPSDGAPPPPIGDAGACAICTDYAAPVLLANAGVSELANLSGAAVSHRNTGVIFAHNDGAEVDVYALGEDGKQLGRFTLPDAGAVDVEDMEVGPCPAGTCLYLGDIGGNRSSRTEYNVLRATEPEVSPAKPAGDVTLTFERFRFSYDDGAAHNAEGLMVDPQTGTAYVITKLSPGQASAAYRLPNPMVTGSVNTATKVADLPVPASSDKEATAASAQPCGGGFILRTYNTVYEFRIAAGAPFEDAFRATPVTVPAATETQSEAISYRPDGRGYITSGEGASAPIYQVLCR